MVPPPSAGAVGGSANVVASQPACGRIGATHANDGRRPESSVSALRLGTEALAVDMISVRMSLRKMTLRNLDSGRQKREEWGDEEFSLFDLSVFG